MGEETRRRGLSCAEAIKTHQREKPAAGAVLAITTDPREKPARAALRQLGPTIGGSPPMVLNRAIRAEPREKPGNGLDALR